MYLPHYNLRSKPFQITADPKFVWLGEKHAETLAALKYGIQEDKGFLVLTGEIGTGKTSLINCLLKELDLSIIKATVPDPDMTVIDFFNFLSDEFKMGMKFNGKGDFLIHFKQFLLNAYTDEKKVLLIIDEAQRLNSDLLEQIRLLSNIELRDAKLINIFFVGQNEFNDLLTDEKNKAVLQRIVVRCRIDPLNIAELKKFIEHRLKVAGTTEEIFTPQAIDEIFSFSQGYPRLINIICDQAMLTGYVNGKKIIDEKTISECAKELRIHSGKRDKNSTDTLYSEKQKFMHVPAPKNSYSWAQPVLIFAIGALVLSMGITFWVHKSEVINSSVQETTFSEAKDNNKNSAILQSDESLAKKVKSNAHLVSILVEKPLIDSEKSHTKLKNSDDNSKIHSSLQEHQPFSKNSLIIQFDLNSFKMTKKITDTLDQLVEFMINSPETKIRVTGYTDSTGDYDYNLSVSRRRADEVKSYLCRNGLNPLKIETLGLGPESPIASNATIEGRRKNRRVEIEFDTLFNDNFVYITPEI